MSDGNNAEEQEPPFAKSATFPRTGGESAANFIQRKKNRYEIQRNQNKPQPKRAA